MKKYRIVLEYQTYSVRHGLKNKRLTVYKDFDTFDDAERQLLISYPDAKKTSEGIYSTAGSIYPSTLIIK